MLQDEILKTWFYQQCQILPGSRRAVLLTGTPDQGPFDQALSWPEDSAGHSTLNRVIQAALRSKKAVLKTQNSTTENTAEPFDALACPIFLHGELAGAVAIEVTSRSKAMQQAAIQQVQTGVKWLETMLSTSSSSSREQLVRIVELLVAALEHDNFQVALAQVVTELAERFSCQQVSLGFWQRNRIRIAAISHSKQIDQQTNQVRALRDAMTEAIDQGTSLVYPAADADSPQTTHFLQLLANQQGGAAICTIPLVKNSQVVGALLLERSSDDPFDDETVEHCAQVGLLLGPVLETRRRDERPLPLKAADAICETLGKLFGPKHLSLKTMVVACCAIILWLSLANGQFVIATDSTLEASVNRVIVAPQDGFIASSKVRAGDMVNAGEPLATLDDKELRSEQRKWQGQRSQILKEYRQALAGFDRSEVAILGARRTQAEAQLKLVEQQLERTTLVAPLSGFVVKGDLSQSLGSPVSRGEVLFEVAPTDEYRVVLKVDDRDIGHIEPGQQGKLRLSSTPDRLFTVSIDRITPVSSTADGRNFFRVEAVIENPSDLLRPGMAGITKVEIGEAKKIWIWTRRLQEWWRLFSWNWLP